jgi:hypothetical protein
MISRKAKFLSAAAAAVALIATVAVAHTVHTHTAPANQAHLSAGKVTSPPPVQTKPAAPYGAIACGMALDADCERLETLLPM